MEHLKDTYGSKRKVVMEVKNVEAVQKLDLAEALGIYEDKAYTAELDVDKKNYTITFDKHKLQAPQILSAVMEVTEVTDIKLQETELAEIVKEIYNHGVNGGN